MRRDLRQAELAESLGYEQSYISALEIGLKGPPTSEFVEKLVETLNMSPSEQEQLHAVVCASRRKFAIDLDAPLDVYWLLNDLREKMQRLSPYQVRMIRDILSMQENLLEKRQDPIRRLKRRRKEEAEM